ncbi:hypothetical protein [Richelia sinica]|nr:hypothetical protein [Richelia sinica]MBD2665728.1 hypothetical protein [Richelia sinica FACHB-800]
MNHSQQKPVSLFVSLVTVILLGMGLYWFISALIDKLNSIDSDLGKAIITGGVTVSIAVLTLVIGKLWEQQVKIQQDIREKKIPVYEKQIEIFFSLIFAEKNGDDKPTQEELRKAFQLFTEKLIIWGSPEVIQAWSEFKLYDWQNSDSLEGFLKVEALLRAIRKDLGNSNSKLALGDISKLFINDFDIVIAETPLQKPKN